MKNPELLLTVVEDVDFYRDNNDHDKFYAEFENQSKKKVFAPVDSKIFKSFLYAKSCDLAEDDEVLEPSSAVKSLCWLLEYQHAYQYVDVYNRISGTLKDIVEYDLQLPNQKTVKITCDGWNISPKERKFIVSGTNLPQVKPKETLNSPLVLLKPFVNLAGDNFVLFVVWLIQAFVRGNHHALLVFAERGSGKSTLSKMIKRITDPCKFDVTTIPQGIDNICVLLNSTHVCCFDNVSSISREVSDLLCGAITGTAIVKRSLYTNSDANVSKLHNVIVINGIGVTPEQDDLAERMLFFQLKKFKTTDTKLEADIWADFEEALPEILGSIFNTLSKAMTEIDSISPVNLPRMADSFVDMLAIAKALGIPENDFRRIYANNKRELEEARIGTPLVNAVKEYMDTVNGRTFKGSASMVYKEIYDHFSGEKSLIPSSASHFSRALDKEHSNLLKAGFRVNIDDTSAKSTEITIIKKK